MRVFKIFAQNYSRLVLTHRPENKTEKQKKFPLNSFLILSRRKMKKKSKERNIGGTNKKVINKKLNRLAKKGKLSQKSKNRFQQLREYRQKKSTEILKNVGISCFIFIFSIFSIEFTGLWRYGRSTEGEHTAGGRGLWTWSKVPREIIFTTRRSV